MAVSVLLRFFRESCGCLSSSSVLYVALITLFQKIGLGAGAGLGLLVTSMFGFDPNGENQGLALTGFFIAFLGIPIILNLFATILALFFPITEKRHIIIRKRLDARAARAV